MKICGVGGNPPKTPENMGMFGLMDLDRGWGRSLGGGKNFFHLPVDRLKKGEKNKKGAV